MTGGSSAASCIDTAKAYGGARFRAEYGPRTTLYSRFDR